MDFIHFTEEELMCKCGCRRLPRPEIILRAVLLRERWGEPLEVRSGARCMAHTLALRASGTPAALKSAHLSGEALDLAPIGSPIAEFHDFVEGQLEALGLYMEDRSATPTWCHIQTRPSRLRVFRP